MGSGAEKVKKLLHTARMQIQQGERKEALETYRKALKLDSENHQIIDRINIVEREIAAMEKFNKSRFSRAHTAGRNISSSGFVDDCIKRSDEAFSANDAVRALQELERARRHDPDNVLVKKKIAFLKRSIKVDGLADLVQNRIKTGDSGFAVENIRRIFDLWPSAPVLDGLLKMLEDYKETASDEIETEVPIVDKVDEQEEEKVAAVPPAETPVKKKPKKRTEKKKFVSPRRKTAGDGQNKMFAIFGIIAAIVILIFAINKFLCGRETQPEVIEDPPAQPFTETIAVLGAEDISMTLDGFPVDEGLQGVFILRDTIFTERTIEVSAPGYETLIWNRVFEEGQIRTDTLYLYSIGTSIIQVTFDYEMPPGEDDPGPQAVSFMIDGELIEGSVDSIATGEHIFQAFLDGYRTLPESVSVISAVDLNQTMNILASEQSLITIQLAADTPGNASFFIDGERVATGRRMTQVLPFGSYYLQVQMTGRREYGVTITLGEDGYNRTVSLEEIDETGQLMVGPEPWSNVYVDGLMVGTTPFGGVELEPGTYTVTLSNPDFQDDTHTVEITTGETTVIQYNAIAAVAPDEVPDDTATVTEPVEDLPISSPFAIQQTSPAIPSQARARGDLHDYVTLAVLVGTDGSVLDVSIINDPLGLGCGQAAVDAVRNWVFSPAMQGDQPVEVTTNVQIRFDIE